MKNQSQKLIIGLPKGSLEKATLARFSKIGIIISYPNLRSLWLNSTDPEIKVVLLRAQEIAYYVSANKLDLGITGLDWITENKLNKKVLTLGRLNYSKNTFQSIHWVLAVNKDLKVKDLLDFKLYCLNFYKENGHKILIATELVEISKTWLKEQNILADVQYSWGASEAKPGYFADAIIDITETGQSLKDNNLKIIANVYESFTEIIAPKKYQQDVWKKNKIDSISKRLLKDNF